MTKKQDPKAESFVERTREHREAEAIRMANELLAAFIREESPFLDVHYLAARAKEIIQLKIKEGAFKNEIINRARRDFLVKTIEEARKAHIRLDNPEDPNYVPDERAKRCESLAQTMAKMVLEQDLLFSDDPYIEDAIENDDQLLLGYLSMGYLDAIYDKLLIALQFNEERANAKKWGNKQREDRTWSDLDSTLK